MCNNYRLEIAAASIADNFANLKIRLGTPEGMPNIEARLDKSQ
jgi:hypothetical protein